MKVMLEKGTSEYVEAKLDGSGKLDLSIRTLASDRKAVLITAKLDDDQLGKLIANLILLKSRLANEER